MERSTRGLLTRKIELLPDGDRRQMKRFLRVLMTFLILQVLVFSALTVIQTLRDSGNYWGASIDKHRRLEEAPSPRMILVGGSGVALGIDSEVLKRITGYNPINMSLAAGLGPEFMLGEVVEDLREGDLVVVVLSYEAFLGNTANRCILGLLHSNPGAIRYVSDPLKVSAMYFSHFSNQLRNAPRAAWELLTGSLGLRTPTPGELRWRRSSFNVYGDVIYEREHSPDLVEQFYRFPEMSDEYPGKVIDLLNDFQSICRSRGATAVLSYAAIPDSTYSLNLVLIERLHLKLENELRMDIIDLPSRMALPYEFFSDTHYHLTREGAAERSRILAKSILVWHRRRDHPDMG